MTRSFGIGLANLKEEEKVLRYIILRHLAFSGFLLTILVSLHGFAQSLFDQKREFPNFFLPPQYRNVAPEQIPPEVIKSIREQLERTMATRFRNMTIPIMKPGEQSAVNVRIFPHVLDNLRRIDPDARLLPSGGMVRSELANIYHEVWRGERAAQPISAIETLKRLEKDQSPIPVMGGKKLGQAGGIGSDIDMLVISSKDTEPLINRARGIVNSAFANFKFRSGKNDLNRSLIPISDVKDYSTQIKRTMRNGGATTDWLAFDFENQRLIEPTQILPESEVRAKNIIDKMISGRYVHALPSSDIPEIEQAITASRGPRVLLEIPYLNVENEADLKKQLNLVRKLIETGKLDEKSLAQFDKMTRNQFYEGAHNRFYRGSPGSVEELVRQISDEYKKKTGITLVPEFLDRFEFDAARSSKTLSPHLFTKVGDFVQKHTLNGEIFHGTPSINNSLSILRGGLFLSSDNQGRAAFGRGTYMSPDLSEANSYAGREGIVFRLKVNQDKPLKILNWDLVKDDPVIQSVVAEAKKLGRDVFEFLARDHGVDIIINKHVLLQNVAAVKFPSTFKEFSQSYADVIRSSQRHPLARLEALRSYEALYEYGLALGEKLPSAGGYKQELIKELKASLAQKNIPISAKLDNAYALLKSENADAVVRTRAIELLTEVYSPANRATINSLASPEMRKDILWQVTTDMDAAAQQLARTALDQDPSHRGRVAALARFAAEKTADTSLTDTFYRVALNQKGVVEERVIAMEGLAKFEKGKPRLKETLTQLIDDPEWWMTVRRTAVSLIGDLKLSSPEILRKLKERVQKDDQPAVISEAKRTLIRIMNRSQILNEIRSYDRETAQSAIYSLGERSDIKDRTQILLGILDDQDEFKRSAAVASIKYNKIKNPEIEQKLMDMVIKAKLANGYAHSEADIIETDPSKEFIKRSMPRLIDGNSETRAWAARLVVKADLTDTESQKLISKLLSHDEIYSYGLFDHIEKHKLQHPDLVKTLWDLANKKGSLADYAMGVLSQMPSEKAKAVQILYTRIMDGSWSDRNRALRQLIKSGETRPLLFDQLAETVQAAKSENSSYYKYVLDDALKKLAKSPVRTANVDWVLEEGLSFNDDNIRILATQSHAQLQKIPRTVVSRDCSDQLANALRALIKN